MALPLLVELLTEELPPRSLAALASAFESELVASLQDDGFPSGERRPALCHPAPARRVDQRCA